MQRRRFHVAFALAALLLAGVVSSFASGSPDGLERVAADHGLAGSEREHPLAGSPLADYGLRGVDAGLLSGGLAGVLGMAVVLLVTAGVAYAVRRRPRPGAIDPDAPPPDDHGQGVDRAGSATRHGS